MRLVSSSPTCRNSSADCSRTTALDATVQYQVIQTLRRLNKERNLAMLVITHDLGMVAELCDRVYVMNGGKVVESADVFALFDAPQNAYTASLLAAARRLHQTKALGVGPAT